jgi:hypothetical protein
MKGRIEYRIFSWGLRAQDFGKTLKEVESFVNRPEITEVVSIINTSFGMLVWYKTVKSLKIALKKP